MKVQQGYSYHIKDDFYDLVKDKYLMSNKEGGSYRPHFYAVQDKKNSDLYWMIPISSQADKYRKVIENKKRKYGKCNTIQGQPIMVHKELNKVLIKNLQDVLAMYESGVKLLFPDVQEIRRIMEHELQNNQC